MTPAGWSFPMRGRAGRETQREGGTDREMETDTERETERALESEREEQTAEPCKHIR